MLSLTRTRPIYVSVGVDKSSAGALVYTDLWKKGPSKQVSKTPCASQKNPVTMDMVLAENACSYNNVSKHVMLEK